MHRIKNMRSFGKVVLLIIVFYALLRSCEPFFQGHNPLAGQMAPDFILETLSGGKKSLHRFRDDRPALIFFWTTWCPLCRRQLRTLEGQRETMEEKGIKIILVDVGESPQEVRAYFDTHGISFDTFFDQDSLLAGHYKINGVPALFFVNTEGIIVDVKYSLPGNYEEVLLGLLL